MFQPDLYLDCSHTEHATLFENVTHVWEVLSKIKSYLEENLQPANHGTVQGNAFIGRGFPPNLPIEIAQDIRAKQNKKISTYDVQKFVELFESIMKNLNIEDFRIIIPKEELEVNYGIWIMFTK